MDNRDDILDKIRKCMALAQSGSEHEAATALRQAQRLMELHKISQAEMLAAGVHESKSKACAVARPAAWESDLATHIAAAFGCKLIFSSSSWGWGEAQWVFIGLPPANEIAAYSLEVLLRQALKARREFIGSTLKRTKKKANKTRRADLFSAGWVHTACAQVGALTPPEGATEAIQAYIQLKHPSLGELSTTDRNAGRNWSDKDQDAYHAGRSAGRGAQLHQGVGANKPLMLGGE
ncbi:DUF2786 domain-containing protein [Thauera butanivorans]|uniref:DUF2786 domain-containing protein n=1 Tax=Thauera butanivorans TaxID=86174 RepID=UPI003AB3FFBB